MREEQVEKENSGSHVRVDYSKDYTVPSMSWVLGDQLAWFARDPGSSWTMGSLGLKVGKSRTSWPP